MLAKVCRLLYRMITKEDQLWEKFLPLKYQLAATVSSASSGELSPEEIQAMAEHVLGSGS